jgi:hypothetical protein
MYKVVNDLDHPAMGNGTSLMGYIDVKYSDLVLAFGEPMESDGYKVSGEWIFIEEESGEVFTIYDWKSTSLYDSDLKSVEQFRALKCKMTFNIGGNHKGSVERFKSLILKQIEYVKIGKPFEQIILNNGSHNE